MIRLGTVLLGMFLMASSLVFLWVCWKNLWLIAALVCSWTLWTLGVLCLLLGSDFYHYGVYGVTERDLRDSEDANGSGS